MNINKSFYDVTIIGAGIVGSALALMLVKAGFYVQLVERISISPIKDDNVIPDLRVSAINNASVKFLRYIGAWKKIDNSFCAPYRRLETWEWPFSVVSFDALSVNLPELGFIVENRRLQWALWQELKDYNELTFCCPASLLSMHYENDFWQLKFNNKNNVISKIVIGADGVNSWVRQQANISFNSFKYCHSCLLLNINLTGKQKDTTWQVFHPTGPRAFLPLYGQWASLVWYDSAERIHELKKLSLTDLEKEIFIAFPKRLGQFTLCSSMSLSLRHIRANVYVKPGLALIGDAAHTINPFAGQGLNLGLRDVQTLAEVLINARECGESWNTLTVLKRYQHRRFIDNLIMQLGIDAIYSVFNNHLSPLVFARNIGLIIVQRSLRIKNFILRYALGLE